MALSLSYTAELNTASSSVLFYDNTGVYDASSNIGGWGAPNDVPGDVTAAVLTVTNYAGVSVTSVNLLSAYTALASSPTEKMLLATIPWTYPDGYYTFTVAITSATALPSSDYSTVHLFLGNAKNAVDQLWIRAFNNGECNCNSKDVREAMRAEVIYQSMKVNEDYITAANVNKITQLSADVIDIAANRQLIP